MIDRDSGAVGAGGPELPVVTPTNDMYSIVESYRVLFERAAFTAQLADDERLHRMLDTLSLLGLVTDANGDVTYMNTAMRERLGRTLDDVVGHGLGADGPEQDDLKRSILSAIEFGQLAPDWTNDLALTDGSVMTVRWTSTFIRDSHGQIRALTSVGEDITRRGAEDARPPESVRMESVGRLAGGIAHDFNNYLAVIGGYADLARSAPGLPESVSSHLDHIDEATRRATELIRQLLAFGRQEVPEPVVISVSDEIADLAGLLRPTFRSSIAVEVVTDTTDDLVKFDRSRLDQIFVNLAFNSREAMPDGGTITYAITDQDVDQQRAEDLGVEPGPYVVVTVTDDGLGIDPEIIDHVFERHVTTKPLGQGGGLGLSTVLGVITQAGGAITIDRDRDSGTGFTLYFRRATTDPSA